MAYRNDHYVLDYWGLASDEARRLRPTATSPAWMDRLADARDVRLVAVYASAFTVPDRWIPLGDLTLGWSSEVVYDERVRFYARDAAAAARARPLLAAWSAGLPGGVQFVTEGER